MRGTTLDEFSKADYQCDNAHLSELESFSRTGSVFACIGWFDRVI